MDILLSGKAIRKFLDTVSIYDYQISHRDSEYYLHLKTSQGDFTILPVEALSTVEVGELEVMLSGKLSKTRNR